MTRRGRLPAALPLLLVGGCVTPGDVGIQAACGQGSGNRVVLLMAQAVPSATRIPCVRLVPEGWQSDRIDVRDGSAQFQLSSQLNGDILTVVLRRSCTVRGASEVPSDQPGTRRYERPQRVDSGYTGERYYTYPGGCTTLRFGLHGARRALPVTELTLAVGLVARSDVRSGVRRGSGNQLDLRTAPTGGAP